MTPICISERNNIVRGEYVRTPCGEPATWKRLIIGRPDYEMFVCDYHKRIVHLPKEAPRWEPIP